MQTAHQEKFGVQYLAQGHLDMQLGGAGNSTNNLPITRQPAVAPELQPCMADHKQELLHPSEERLKQYEHVTGNCRQNVHYLCQ